MHYGLTVDGVSSRGKNRVVRAFAAARPGTQVPNWAAAVPDFATDHALALPGGPVEIEVHVDCGIVEVALDQGRIWITQIHFPADPGAPVRLTGSGAA